MVQHSVIRHLRQGTVLCHKTENRPLSYSVLIISTEQPPFVFSTCCFAEIMIYWFCIISGTVAVRLPCGGRVCHLYVQPSDIARRAALNEQN